MDPFNVQPERQFRNSRRCGQPRLPFRKFALALGLPADADLDAIDERIAEVRALGFEVVDRGYLERVELIAAGGPGAFAGLN